MTNRISKYSALCIFFMAVLLSCSVQADTSYDAETKTAVKSEVLSMDGVVTMIAQNSVTIRTANGMEYCFAIGEDTKLDEKELEIDDTVTISYMVGDDNSQIAASVLFKE